MLGGARLSGVHIKATEKSEASKQVAENSGKSFGGSPLLQQGELDFSPAEKQSILKWALALGRPFDPQR
jgi:hypothetical protein